MLDDKSVDGLGKAKDADVFAYVVQAFETRRTSSSAAATCKDANAVDDDQSVPGDYAWGRAELVEYKNERGERLQGALYYPAGYEPGKKYPMVVYIYERLSDGVHR